MGERFYLAQQRAIGTCPGTNPNKKRKLKMAWTEEDKAKAIELYKAKNPTAENSMEIVVEVAEEMEESPNGVRMILSKAGVYIKKAPAAGKASGSTSGGSTRVSKEDAQDGLKAAISDAGGTPDEDIIGKLTGKAAVYFTGVIQAIVGE